jgi:hypothetical protein
LIDANTLLNPEYQNAELRAYAFLSAQYKHGVRSTIDCLKPFVIYAIADQAGNQLNWPTIRTYLREKYGLSVPFYMLERMEWALRDAKAIIKTENSHILICGDARPSISENDADFTINDIDRLGGALQRFAANRGMEKPLTAENWNDIIVPFFMNRSPPGDKETAKVRGVLISDPKTYDFTIVADFIMDGYASMSPSYKMVERVYYGVLVAEFLTQIESAGNKASFKGLGVVYDAPVILRLLGCSGKIFKDATLELHDTLRDLGCKTYFFAHTYDEISIAIEAILKCYENGQPMFRETQEAISRREISINDIYSIKADLDLRLAGLGLLEHSAGYSSRNSDDFQIDEAGFKDRLQKYRSWGSAGSLAAERDVMSLALIMRLRNGKQVRDVSKSGFVFITHNTRLANMSKDFLRTEGQLNDGAVWPILTVGQISTIAWVVNETFQDDKKITKELIANCYSAALPDDDFDARLKEILTKTDPTKAHELYNNAFLIQSVRHVALSHTGGHSSLVKTLSTAELLAEAEEYRKVVTDAARTEGRDEAKIELGNEANQRHTEKARSAASALSKAIMVFVVLGSATLIARDYGLLGPGENTSKFVSYGLFILGIYGALDLFGVLPSASVRNFLEDILFKGVRYIQKLLT